MILRGKELEKDQGSIRLVGKDICSRSEKSFGNMRTIFLQVRGNSDRELGRNARFPLSDPGCLRTLTDTMIKAVDGACPVAVRKPAQWRELTLGLTEQEKKKLTLFNDGIFGSETDLRNVWHTVTGNAGTENLQPGRRTGMAEKRNVRKILRRRGHMGKWGRTDSFVSARKSNGGYSKECIFPI